MMNYDIVNPLDYPQWDEMLLSCNDYSVFHSSYWAKVLIDSYNYRPKYFSKILNNKIKALLPLIEINSCLTGARGVSIAFTDYCEPIVADRIQFEQLFKQVLNHGKIHRWKTIEVRGGEKYLLDCPESARFLGHNLDLSNGPENVYTSFRDSTKRNIKKAKKEGVVVERFNSLESMMIFYELHCLTRKKHGLPPQPKKFFYNLHKHLVQQDKGFILVAKHENQPVAASVYLHFGKKAIYKYGASDEQYQRLRANNLVMWEAIKWYASNGYNSFCFGRSDYLDEGLRQYKNGWGTVEREIKYFKYDIVNERFIGEESKKDNSSRYMSKLPIPLLRCVGHYLYKHVG